MLESTKSWQAADHVGASASIYRIREQSATLDRCARCCNKTERLPRSDLENTAKCVARRGSVLQCSLCKLDRLGAVINLDRARARSTSLRQTIDGRCQSLATLPACSVPHQTEGCRGGMPAALLILSMASCTMSQPD